MSKPGEQFTAGCLFLIIGLAMVTVGAWLGWNSYRSLQDKAEATATVINVEVIEGGPDDSAEYFPTVQFTTADGQFITSTPRQVRQSEAFGGLVTVNNSDDGYETEYEVGDEVTVYYDPAHPAEVVLNDFNMLWVAPLVVGGLGGLFAFIAVPITLIALVRWLRR
jgi:hypothetical protein